MRADRKTGKLSGLSERTSDIILVVVCAVVLFIVAYPLYYVLVASVSDPYDVYAGKTFLLPSQFTIDGSAEQLQVHDYRYGLFRGSAVSDGLSAQCERPARPEIFKYLFHYYHVFRRRYGSYIPDC